MRIPSLLFTVILALLAVDATAQDTRRATIYYYGWDVFTRTAMTIADVRARYYTKIEIANADEAVSFASKLVARKMTANAKHLTITTSLVKRLERWGYLRPHQPGPASQKGAE